MLLRTREARLVELFPASFGPETRYFRRMAEWRGLFLLGELPLLIGFGWLAFDVGVRGSWLLLLGTATLGSLCAFWGNASTAG